MNDYFLIAKVVAPFGKNGFVKIFSFSDFPDRLFKLEKVYIDFFGKKKTFYIEKVVKTNEFFTLKFKNFNNEEDVGVLSGKELFIDETDLMLLPEDHFYIHDLVGSKVIRNDKDFGLIKDVLKLPANDVYVIEDSEGKELLIPAVEDYIEKFDLENKVLILKPGRKIYEDDED